jgi:hypothetical protein
LSQFDTVLDYNRLNLVGKQTQIHRNVMVWTGVGKNAHGPILVEVELA